MIVLASRSPRRAELLHAAGYDFVVRTADIDETPRPGEAPRDYVLRLAIEKAAAVPAAHEEIVLGADTSVIIGNEILGKPIDQADAARMLRILSGRKHEVLTGVCLKRGAETVADVASTCVSMAHLTEEDIDWYVASDEPMDKAGAYAIQGLASRFIERIDGSYSNVVGLPVTLVRQLLGRFA
jgi:septum formation protein